MDKIIKKFFISFLLIAILPCLTLILFQKVQTENKMNLLEIQQEYYSNNLAMLAPPPKPPIAIPIIVLLFSCSGLCYIWTKYLEKNFITPLKDIVLGLKKYDSGNLNINFKTTSENEFIISTFNTLNLMVKNTKEKEKLKSNYIQSLIHDLKAPIMAQDRAIKILKEEFSEHELIDGLEKNTEKYIKLINLILESYYSSSSEVKINPTKLNFTDFINDIIKELTPLAQEKNITISYTKQTENDLINADYFSLTRIITNLIVNSIENIDYNKNIEITLINNENTIIIIKDNGKGIKKEDIESIFNKYITNKTTSATSGLGLNIVKELIIKNNGKIEVESELEKFTKFTITLNNDKKDA